MRDRHWKPLAGSQKKTCINLFKYGRAKIDTFYLLQCCNVVLRFYQLAPQVWLNHIFSLWHFVFFCNSDPCNESYSDEEQFSSVKNRIDPQVWLHFPEYQEFKNSRCVYDHSDRCVSLLLSLCVAYYLVKRCLHSRSCSTFSDLKR